MPGSLVPAAQAILAWSVDGGWPWAGLLGGQELRAGLACSLLPSPLALQAVAQPPGLCPASDLGSPGPRAFPEETSSGSTACSPTSCVPRTGREQRRQRAFTGQGGGGSVPHKGPRPQSSAPSRPRVELGKSGLWGRGRASTDDAPGFPGSPHVLQARGQRPHRVVVRMEGSPRRPPPAWLLKMLWTPSDCPTSWSLQQSSGQSQASAERSAGREGVDAGI